MEEEDSNIPMIARHVFRGSKAHPPGSIQLGLDDCAPPGASPAFQAQIISEVLMALFLEGVRIRFGADQSPATLTEAQLQSMTDYMRSCGFSFHVLSKPIDEPPPVPTTPRQQLKDFSERFYDFDRQMWHQLSFDWIRVIQ